MKKMLVCFLTSCKKFKKFLEFLVMSYPKEKAPFPHPGLPISQLELRPLSGGAPSREFIYHPIPMPKGFVQKEPLNMTPLKDQIRETDR